MFIRKWLVAFILSCVIATISLCYMLFAEYISNFSANYSSKDIKIFHGYSISFDSLRVKVDHGRLGIVVNNLVEHYSLHDGMRECESIYYSSPVFIGFSPFHMSVFLEYTGEALAKYTKESDANYKLNGNLHINLKLQHIMDLYAFVRKDVSFDYKRYLLYVKELRFVIEDFSIFDYLFEKEVYARDLDLKFNFAKTSNLDKMLHVSYEGKSKSDSDVRIKSLIFGYISNVDISCMQYLSFMSYSKKSNLSLDFEIPLEFLHDFSEKPIYDVSDYIDLLEVSKVSIKHFEFECDDFYFNGSVNKLLAKPIHDERVQETYIAQERSVLNAHDALSTEATTSPSEIEFRKKSDNANDDKHSLHLVGSIVFKDSIKDYLGSIVNAMTPYLEYFGDEYAMSLVGVKNALLLLSYKDPLDLEFLLSTKGIDNKQMLYLEYLSILCREVGFIADGKVVFDKNDHDVSYDSSVIIKNYNNILDIFFDVFYKEIYRIEDELVLRFKKDVMKSFLKKISIYPDSKSEDVVLRASDLLSQMDWFAIYQRIALETAIKYASKLNVQDLAQSKDILYKLIPEYRKDLDKILLFIHDSGSRITIKD